MKILDIDWTALFDFTKAWDELTPELRCKALELKGSEVADTARFADAIEQLERAGMLERFHGGARVRPTQAFRPALRVLRFMNRVPILLDTNKQVLEDYLTSNLTNEERGALIDEFSWTQRLILPATIRSEEWLRGFVECDDASGWEHERLPEPRFGTHQTHVGAVLDRPASGDLKRLLRTLMSDPRPVPFAELQGRVGRISRPKLATAVWAGLRYLLAFAGFSEDGRPALGLLPAVSARIHRAPAQAPERVEPGEVCTLAWGLEDVIQLVVFCSEPRRVRSADKELFAKAERELAELLPHLPDWMGGADRVPIRLRRAYRMAEGQGLVAIRRDGRAYWLEATEEGRRWISLPAPERARELIEPMRASPSPEEEDLDLDLDLEWGPLDSELADAFAGLDGPVSLPRFVLHRAECANPLLQGPRRRSSYGVPTTGEALEEAWGAQLLELVEKLLAPFGGVHLGRLGPQRTFELTDVGRYLLGLSDRFEWAEVEAHGTLLVQPDFEIVFLAANPALEASILPFAERIGKRVGTLFRLTRPSVQSATRAGLTGAEILSTLAGASKAPLPDNVVHEVTGWCEQTIHLAWEPAHLLRCRDEETAARVLAAAKGKLASVGPTVLALLDPKQRTAITTACRKAGVFLDPPPEEAKPKRKSRKRRRGWGW